MVSFWFLVLLLAVIAVQANNATVDGVDSMLTAADNAVLEEANNASIALAENSTVVFKDAPCHPNQTEFAAMTEFTLEGRNDHMTVEEGLRIEREFIAVYNYLAAINCDSHFRRLALISKVNSTNSLGHVVFDYVPVRRQQQSLQTNNSTGAGLSVMYNVSGTCRGCPITDAGSFQMYDQAFRRRMLRTSSASSPGGILNYRVRLRTLSVKSIAIPRQNIDALSNATGSNTDCQCAHGSFPEAPRAPNVDEVVLGMNGRFEDLRSEQPGVFESLNFAENGLFQHDDLTQIQTDLVEDEKEELLIDEQAEGEEEEDDNDDTPKEDDDVPANDDVADDDDDDDDDESTRRSFVEDFLDLNEFSEDEARGDKRRGNHNEGFPGPSGFSESELREMKRRGIRGSTDGHIFD